MRLDRSMRKYWSGDVYEAQNLILVARLVLARMGRGGPFGDVITLDSHTMDLFADAVDRAWKEHVRSEVRHLDSLRGEE